jgi:hypothetical protein
VTRIEVINKDAICEPPAVAAGNLWGYTPASHKGRVHRGFLLFNSMNLITCVGACIRPLAIVNPIGQGIPNLMKHPSITNLFPMRNSLGFIKRFKDF